MKSFLESVAADLLGKFGNDMSTLTVVFPNKRAALFLNDSLARLAQGPVWSPRCITISQLFRSHSPLEVADPMKLVADLYKTHGEVTGSAETLDEFYGWGQLMVSDFDDIDKNMADVGQLFANVANWKEYDSVDYLSDSQKEALKRFFSKFDDMQESKIRERFIRLWKRLPDIYRGFNERLAGQGLAYEGGLYRSVVEGGTAGFTAGKYAFVGFNLLQKVERRLLSALAKEGKALFYWDFDHYYYDDRAMEAGAYARENVARFGSELDLDEGGVYSCFGSDKDIVFASAPTENLQARFVADWLKEGGRMQAGNRTAIVMADERLLPTVLHSLPPEVGKVNVTTGYPLSQTPAWQLVNTLVRLQTLGKAGGGDRYRAAYVSKVLLHPYMKYVSGKSADVAQALRAGRNDFPTAGDLCADEGLSFVFTPLPLHAGVADTALPLWLIGILERVARGAGGQADALFQESLFRMHSLVGRMHNLMVDGTLAVDTPTFERILAQEVASTSVPFHGEPAEGVQVMGILETRNLDFDHVLLLSADDGNIPGAMADRSFIPYSIRKEFGLTTLDNKAAVYAYYFYHLLQRAGDVTIAYNSSVDNGHARQPSRFMTQLMVEWGGDIRRVNLVSAASPGFSERRGVEKDETVMAKLANNGEPRLSPSGIMQYVKCPKRFYYERVAGIRESEDEDGAMDNRVFGNVFHGAAEAVYKELLGAETGTLCKSQLVAMAKNKAALSRIVERVLRREVFGREDHKGKLNGLQLINAKVVADYLARMLMADGENAPVDIVGLERKVEFEVDLGEGLPVRRVKIGGTIDRIDRVSIPGGELMARVVDYKTGSKPAANVASLEDVFAGKRERETKGGYVLQSMLYSIIAAEKVLPGESVATALLFLRKLPPTAEDSLVVVGKDRKEGLVKDIGEYKDEFMDLLKGKLSEIYDKSVPFSPAKDPEACENCPYAHFC